MHSVIIFRLHACQPPWLAGTSMLVVVFGSWTARAVKETRTTQYELVQRLLTITQLFIYRSTLAYLEEQKVDCEAQVKAAASALEHAREAVTAVTTRFRHTSAQHAEAASRHRQLSCQTRESVRPCNCLLGASLARHGRAHSLCRIRGLIAGGHD